MLVGGVGYRHLRDFSVGPYVVDRLAERAGDGIEVEDLSYHPVGLSQNLEERPAYDRLILVGAMRRGRDPGTIESYRWDAKLPAVEEVQARVAEAVTGVISLENLLVVCTAFGGFPDDVRVIELEPVEERWGDGFSPEVEKRIPELVEAVWNSTAR